LTIRFCPRIKADKGAIMSDKSQTLQQPVPFEASWRPSFLSYYFPSLLMTVLLLLVAFWC
jgi:hypothetical protein